MDNLFYGFNIECKGKDLGSFEFQVARLKFGVIRCLVY